jgi:hypothetical protein
MNQNFEKDNPLNLQLAKDAHAPEAKNSNVLEVAICHELYRRHPDAIEHAVFLRMSIDDFHTTLHDLERRGIVRVDLMGNRKLFSLTREFADIMRNL